MVCQCRAACQSGDPCLLTDCVGRAPQTPCRPTSVSFAMLSIRVGRRHVAGAVLAWFPCPARAYRYRPCNRILFVSRSACCPACCYSLRSNLGKACSQRTSWTEFANSAVNGRIGIRVLRTNRALTVLITLQPIKIHVRRIVATLTRVTNERVVWMGLTCSG